MTSRCVSSTSMTPRVPTMPISNPYTAPGHTVGSAQLMFMLNTMPSSIVKMPDVPSLVPIGPSVRSVERAYTSTGRRPSISHMHMSRLCVPDTTMGVSPVVSSTLRSVASGTIRFMNARVTTVVTSPIWPSRNRCLTVWNRRRNRWV